MSETEPSTIISITDNEESMMKKEIHKAILSKRKGDPKTFLGVKLNKGISRLNFCGHIMLQFTTFVMIGMVMSYVISILEDPDYYNVGKSEIGAKVGVINSWSEGFVIMEVVVLGPIMDTFGRKLILIVGFLVCGVCTMLIPFFPTLYPGYFIFRSLIAMGATTGMNVPLLPDYV
jgi:MFS family permease